jgi:hypothetical protein
MIWRIILRVVRWLGTRPAPGGRYAPDGGPGPFYGRYPWE